MIDKLLVMGGDSEKISMNTKSHGPGWRVEFRPLEIQLTDFENAAFAIIIAFLSRFILSRQSVNFFLPLSLVEENMRRAELANAARTQKFYFPESAFNTRVDKSSLIVAPEQSDIVELSLDEIFNGNSQFPGILPELMNFVETSSGLKRERSVIAKLSEYISLLRRRASGELPTAAQWIRSYVKQHPDYVATCSSDDSDSVAAPSKVPATTASDLLQLCDDIGMGRVACPELLGVDVTVSAILNSCESCNFDMVNSTVK